MAAVQTTTDILGPMCPQCGWRTGTPERPRPHRPAMADKPACPDRVIGTALEHSIEDPFTGEVTVRILL